MGHVTFSVVARCPDSGMLGVAISTAIPAVGALCPAVVGRAGALTSQAWVNPYLRIDGMAVLRSGGSADDVLRLLDEDPGGETRQVGVVDAHGRSAAFTGADCVPWCGHVMDEGYAIQGNMLVGEETLLAMETTWHHSAGSHLAERLVACLESGQGAGGDLRGRQSAALLVADREEYPLVDLRVDDHPEPVDELRRIWSLTRVQLLPFMQLLPSRNDPAGRTDPAVTEVIMASPADRPVR